MLSIFLKIEGICFSKSHRNSSSCNDKVKQSVFAIFVFCNDFQTNENLERFKFGSIVTSGEDNSTSSENGLTGLDQLVIILRSQHDSYHRQKAERFKKKLNEQITARALQGQLILKMLHEDWAPYGAWTIFPIINILANEFLNLKSWFFFCEDDTLLDLHGVLRVLGRYNYSEEHFLGHALQDPQPAIIHHFAFYEDPSKFSFPDFSAGWAMSSALLKRLAQRLVDKPLEVDFSIDVQHEVAMYIFHDGKGIKLTDIPEFCTSTLDDDETCVTSFIDSSMSCGELSNEDLFFAVKTTKKYHKDRVPVIKNTIGQYTSRIVYYSETVDASIPTEDTGVPNMESGHCDKLWAIMKNSQSNKKAEGMKWLVVVDDDSIMSVSRLRRLLACYNSKEKILLGERYGYGCNAGRGYEYITGGGGMVLSKVLVDAMLRSDCGCQSPDAPDDMVLGQCYRMFSLHTVHSSSFHQARPVEYSPKLLAHQIPVSFHKHYDIDPYKVYEDYLS
ncbi:beta-1,3-glucosyltransferase-like isoform X2 [Xenia sp. Carnegie-2017]|uniref:beta-1,3-glucosyltransferase-like isoform X2 n=1 Tax=Xenia sp. Carnegie-2017 TaxID=2897299 RepID=UPI001F0443E1|nr:beta-1,3-glucosyltransferase-like isoform X2 [Xenia sp. Carnegie-2017]